MRPSAQTCLRRYSVCETSPPPGVALLLGILTVAGCDARTAPEGSQDQAQQTVAPAALEPSDLAPGRLVGLTLESTGDFRPNSSTVFTVTIASGPEPLNSVKVDLVLPELTEFQRDPTSFRGVPPNSRMTPHASWSTVLSPRSSQTREFSVRFPEPGLYSVYAKAQAIPTVRNSAFLGDEDAAIGWVLIAETGGRFSPKYDKSMLLADAVSFGPFRSLRDAPRVLGEGSGNFCLPGNCPQRNCCFGGTLTYTNPISSVSEPMGNVEIQVNFQTGESFYTTTSGSGMFAGLPCAKPAENGWVYFNLTYPYATVYDHGASGFQFATITSAACNTVLTHNSLLAGPVVFEHIATARNNGLGMFNRSRGWIQLDIVDSSSSDKTSRYIPTDDRIRIIVPHVYTLFGGFTHAHEYGHALHATFAHGNPGSGSCSGAHLIDVPNTVGCAYSEGWADYFSISVLPTNHFDLKPEKFEENVWHWIANNPTHGDQIEGAVAGYLLDMSDPVNSVEGDAQALPASFVASIFSSCVHLSLGAPAYISGLRPCFEGTLTPTNPYTLSPSVQYPAQWSYGPMAQAYTWNISAIR